MDFDVIVVGGGITGAGVLRDCALRGLRAVLLEKGEPGAATTASSTHLIHGGLRYLLYDRITTHTTSWDSGNIVRLARPLVKRLPILWPVYRGHRHGVETVETLLECYDSFQPMKLGLPHLRLNREDTLALSPGLAPEGLLGALSFDEWWVDAEGLVAANLEAARGHGAEVLVRTRAARLVLEGGRVRGVEAAGPNGTRMLPAPVVVNAAGPWIDAVSRLAGPRIELRLRKGTHLVYDRPLSPVGLALQDGTGERFVFVLPHRGGTLVGPTDLDCPPDPDGIRTAPEEIAYLREALGRYLPAAGAHARTTVGARPILGQSGSEKLLSREYEIFDHGAAGAEGLLTAGGGKMSDFRLMAKDAVDLACRKLGRDIPCRTDRVTLSGAELPEPPAFPRPNAPLKRFLRANPRIRELHAWVFLAAAYARHLCRRARGAIPWADAERFRAHYTR